MSISDRWTEHEDSLSTELECGDFMTAVDLINQIANLAESHNHHPDICLRSYSKLEIKLQTHDSGGLSSKDEKLAVAIDGLLDE